MGKSTPLFQWPCSIAMFVYEMILDETTHVAVICLQRSRKKTRAGRQSGLQQERRVTAQSLRASEVFYPVQGVIRSRGYP